jgi:ribosomally synthesized peptide (two-chain TOMM family)
MSTRDLLEFRTTYLRAIAEAWHDKTFLCELTHNAIQALHDRFDYTWPWSHMCDLSILAFDRSEWIGDKWAWPNFAEDTLTLSLPLDPTKPPAILEQLQAMALADYYQQRPSLFGDQRIEPGPSRLDIAGGTFIPPSNAFTSFEVAMLAAMAKAWQDESYRRLLTLNVATALLEIQGYKLPWDMGILVSEDTVSTWHGQPGPGSPLDRAATRSHRRFGWTFNSKHMLKLYIPKKPSDVRSEALALGLYNAAGAAYPFTCCVC